MRPSVVATSIKSLSLSEGRGRGSFGSLDFHDGLSFPCPWRVIQFRHHLLAWLNKLVILFVIRANLPCFPRRRGKRLTPQPHEASQLYSQALTTKGVDRRSNLGLLGLEIVLQLGYSLLSSNQLRGLVLQLLTLRRSHCLCLLHPSLYRVDILVDLLDDDIQRNRILLQHSEFPCPSRNSLLRERTAFSPTRHDAPRHEHNRHPLEAMQ